MSKAQEYTDAYHRAGGLPDLQAVKIIEELEAELQGIADREAAVLKELPTDEEHCSCAAILFRRTKELEAEVERLRELLETAARQPMGDAWDHDEYQKWYADCKQAIAQKDWQKKPARKAVSNENKV